MSARGKYATLVAVVGFAGVMGALPFVIAKRATPLVNKEGPLTGSQVQRGQFMNSGSKDVGPDPDWDRDTMTYNPQKRH
ncbi:hypothetical protein CTAYLR_007443 [Chrysophaeum taylorii]|uniref:Uncharacterized protein n=1 Tax=Chrysophaeum taylorii TaxID=2483200 RepID=A0AAD7XII8_9STRA|nr:hypothetical protein CTAYLR_007443 [Chrysophaeum taylorii]